MHCYGLFVNTYGNITLFYTFMVIYRVCVCVSGRGRVVDALL